MATEKDTSATGGNELLCGGLHYLHRSLTAMTVHTFIAALRQPKIRCPGAERWSRDDSFLMSMSPFIAFHRSYSSLSPRTTFAGTHVVGYKVPQINAHCCVIWAAGRQHILASLEIKKVNFKYAGHP